MVFVEVTSIETIFIEVCGMLMMEAISDSWHIFRSVSYIRIFYSPVITRNSSFKTTVMEIIIKLCKHWLTSSSHTISIVAFVVFVEVTSIETIFIEVCGMLMMEAISDSWHIFRSVSYIRIFYSPVITRNSSFKTAVMEIIIKFFFTINLSVVTFVVLVEETIIITSWAQFCVMKGSVIISYAFDVFWSISYRRIIRAIIINFEVTFNTFILVC